jgi:transcriptional regulator with XRE-family HTH domain
MSREMDVSALYGALDSKRSAQNLSWRELATELRLSPSIFTRLARGSRPHFDSYILMIDWLGVSMESFVDGKRPEQAKTEETVTAIAAHLRPDSGKPQNAKTIERVVQAAYQRKMVGT